MRNGILIEIYKGYEIRYMNRLFFSWSFNDKELYHGFKNIDDLKKYIDAL